MAFRMSNDAKNALCGSVITMFAGTVGSDGTATLFIREGTQPNTADENGTGGTLCVITGIGWNEATSGTAGLNSGTGYAGTAERSGTAGWGRLECINEFGTCRIDGDVGTSFYNVFTINNPVFTSGGLATLLSANIYMV